MRTESKDPLPACSEMSPARRSHDAACGVRTPRQAGDSGGRHGVLRLRLVSALIARRPILAQDDRAFEIGRIKVDFQVNGETYFVSLADDEQRWLVFVEGEAGPRRVPVYEDQAEFDDFKLVVEDKQGRKILN